MNICMNVCMYEYMYVCVYVCLQVCTLIDYVFIRIDTRVARGFGEKKIITVFSSSTRLTPWFNQPGTTQTTTVLSTVHLAPSSLLSRASHLNVSLGHFLPSPIILHQKRRQKCDEAALSAMFNDDCETSYLMVKKERCCNIAGLTRDQIPKFKQIQAQNSYGTRHRVFCI